jgi:hypothetical protein
MTIIVVRNQEAAGRTRQGIAPAQPCATRDSAQINSKRGRATVSRNSAAYQPLRMRAGGSDDRTLNRGGFLPNQFLPASFQSVATAHRADTGGLSLALPAHLRFEFFGAFTALRAVFPRLHSALRVLQDFACDGAKSFQVLSLSARVMGLAAGVYGQHTDRRKMKCPTKALKDSTK